MIKINNPADCCGCTACMNVCPHDAITMLPDTLGFKYPIVDETKCVDCGLCEKVCAFNDNYDISHNLVTPDIYGARHKDLDQLKTSRSGAAFIAISDWVLRNGGVVYGAGYTEHFKVTHKRATTRDERDEFKGSKYVQSELGDIFRQVKEDLKNGLIVLFSGTPCQTAGLNAYIGSKYRVSLYLVDIVCHGVPSPYIWRDYLKFLEEKEGQVITWVNFRDKQEFGWAAHHETFKFMDGQKTSNSYTYLFYKHIMFRHSCGNCHFCNTRRPSDITIADFWGWQKTDPEINKDDKGISLVFCNTEKGRSLFDDVKSDLYYVPAKISDVLQPNLLYPSIIHPKRLQFEKDYAKKGFKYVFYKYGEDGWRYKLSSLKNNIIKKIRKIKSILLSYFSK